MRWSPVRAAGLALALAATGACYGDGPSLPEPEQALVGTYTAEGTFGAVVFTTQEPGGSETVDWLARGASIRLVLNADMTTTGRLFVPGADEDGGDIDEDLVGTWSLHGGVVRLSHEADTFLRDLDLTVDGNRLVGEHTWSRTVHVELVRR